MSLVHTQEQHHALGFSPFENVQFSNTADFNAHIAFMRYVDAFCDMFSTRAPSAWEDLLRLQEIAEAIIFNPITQGLTKPDEQLAHNLLTTSIEAWAGRLNINASWVVGVARLTLFTNSVARLLSLPPVTTFDYKHKPFAAFSDDGTVELGWDVLTLDPMAEMVSEFNLGVQSWDPLAETLSNFKKRMHAELDALIHSQGLDQEKLVDPVTNLFWIESFIDVRVLGQSVRKTASSHHVSRPAVDKAVEQVTRILRFPPAT
jgi:hypothetical protein